MDDHELLSAPLPPPLSLKQRLYESVYSTWLIGSIVGVITTSLFFPPTFQLGDIGNSSNLVLKAVMIFWLLSLFSAVIWLIVFSGQSLRSKRVKAWDQSFENRRWFTLTHPRYVPQFSCKEYVATGKVYENDQGERVEISPILYIELQRQGTILEQGQIGAVRHQTIKTQIIEQYQFKDDHGATVAAAVECRSRLQAKAEALNIAARKAALPELMQREEQRSLLEQRRSQVDRLHALLQETPSVQMTK